MTGTKLSGIETIHTNHDINVFYVTASSFPEGVMAAHERLREVLPVTEGRNFFGLSRPEKGGDIVYRAAVEEQHPGESKQLNCDTLVIKKGRYVSLTVYNYPTDELSIGRAFALLLEKDGLDPLGYCVEMYLNDTDVKCMVRLEK